MKIPTKYIILYVLFMLLLFIPFYFYIEKKDELKHQKAQDFYKANINIKVIEYLKGWTFSLNNVDYKYSNYLINCNCDFFYKPTETENPITRSFNFNKTHRIVWNELEEPYFLNKSSNSDSIIIYQNNKKFIFRLEKY